MKKTKLLTSLNYLSAAVVSFVLLFCFNFVSVSNADLIYNGDYTINGNDDIAGLSGYTSVTGTLRINGCSSLVGLESLTEVGYKLEIKGCSSLVGLENLTKVGRKLLIYYNSMTDLTGLNNLTGVYELAISSNNALQTLSGLENLTNVAQIRIVYNHKLTTLEGLNNITMLMDTLLIDRNIVLTDISALQNLTAIGPYHGGYFKFTENWALCTYLIEDLRDHILADGGIGDIITIENNKNCERPCQPDFNGDGLVDQNDVYNIIDSGIGDCEFKAWIEECWTPAAIICE